MARSVSICFTSKQCFQRVIVFVHERSTRPYQYCCWLRQSPTNSVDVKLFRNVETVLWGRLPWVVQSCAWCVEPQQQIRAKGSERDSLFGVFDSLFCPILAYCLHIAMLATSLSLTSFASISSPSDHTIPTLTPAYAESLRFLPCSSPAS